MDREIRITLNARPYQKPVIDYFRGGGKHAYEVWHRRAGKDRVATFIESEMAMKRVGLYWHTLPEFKHARRVIWENITGDGQRLIDINFPREMVAKRRDHEMMLELVNGSIWQLVGADNFDSLIGANPVHVTFSEFATTHPLAREFIRPILAENNGSELLITTPRGYNHAYKLWQRARADPRWHTSLITVDDSKLLSDQVLADERADMPDELYRQEYYCDFAAANVGAIFGRYIEEAEHQGRIVQAMEPAPLNEVIITSDIGYRDKAAWWWWRVMPGGFELIDYDEGSGLDAEEWITRLEERSHANRLILPHDARAKTFNSRHSAVEVFLRDGHKVADDIKVNPQRKKADSINAGRKVLRRCRFLEPTTSIGLEALRDYHFKYDPETKAFSSEPEHNWSSHGADAFMEGAAHLEDYVAPEKKPDPHAQLTVPMHHAFTLDQLWDTVGHGNESRRV